MPLRPGSSPTRDLRLPRAGGEESLSLPPGREADLLVPAAPRAGDPPAVAPDVAARAFARSVELVPGPVFLAVPDRTRDAPLSAMAPRLVEGLVERGVAPRDLTLAIASGTHRTRDADVSPERLGPIDPAVRILRHDPADAVHDAGTTPAGTRVLVHPAMFEAPNVLAAGGIAFHYFAGFGGGTKMLFPGFGGRASIAANHARALGPLPPGGLAPGVAPGKLAGNPVAADLKEVARLLPRARQLTVWSAGGGVHAEAWSDLDAFSEVAARYASGRSIGDAHAYDLVLASAGGPPRDIDVVQSHKALFHAARYAKPGGTIVLVADVPEGFGSDPLARRLAESPGDLEALERGARERYDLNAQTAVSLANLARRTRVLWVAGRVEPLLERWGVQFLRTLEEAWKEASPRADARIAALPRATEVVPRDEQC